MRSATLLVAALLCACAALAAAAPADVGATMHDNYVYFDSNVSVTATFSLDRFAVSGGQPFKGVTFSGSALDVLAGRHGSTGPAAEFIDDMTLLNMVASTHILAEEPKELNFAVFGTFNLTLGSAHYVLPNFRIAQGHYATTNNWWIAASYCTNDPATGSVTLVCHVPTGGKVQFHGESSDHFYVLEA